ncbi:dioxygenases related to 2-nitropropane dioxygenase [Clostridium sp. CAG:411]|jgi:nitronate monooxygenase|nr:dioxygenases related to 2-nitropropane dioxygenase [Clostridium sp. CAG:411]
MKELRIGNKVARLPIIQGGMGVGVSRGRLAGAVAKEGGIGIISTAQIGYDLEGFDKDQEGCNLRAIREHIAMAKEMSNGGLVGVNVMVALKQYREHVKEAVKAGADVVICGAGLPMDLPELVAGSDTKIAPIVSSARAARLLLQKWKRRYDYIADFLVIEGPKAGGHLGFTKEDAVKDINFDEEIKAIIAVVRDMEEKCDAKIPVIVAGGIFDKRDIDHVISLGADGVQIASRFVATYECDASDAYKQAYINAKAEDVRIIQSPVGMPGRAVNNAFLKKVDEGKVCVDKCYKCLGKCNPAEIPYCITKALVNAVKGDLDNGLIFCGANVGRINTIVSVHELMAELTEEIEVGIAETERIAG